MIFIVDLFLCVRRVSFPVSAEEAVAQGGGGEGGKLWCWAGGGGKLWCWAGGYYKENSEFMNTKHIQVRVLGWFTIVFWALLKIVIPFPKLRALLACVVVCCSYLITWFWQRESTPPLYQNIRIYADVWPLCSTGIARYRGLVVQFCFHSHFFFSFLFFFFSIPQNILELSTCQPGCSRHLVRGVHSTKNSCQIDCLPPWRADRDIPVQIGDRWKSCVGWKRFLDCYPGCHLGWAILFGHVSI